MVTTGEINPTRSPSPEVNEVAANPEETDSDEEEAGSFDEDVGGFDEEEGGGFNEEGKQNFNKEGGVFSAEEVAQDSDLERRGKDADSVVHVEGEKVGKECEMPGISYMGQSWFCAKFRGFWAGTCSNHARRTINH